ncbi:hypothetical protein POM88_011801 [Heracleum sosnowskyi]|uniref:RRM domain-containing protein n=1 Tax=Heracleum sosnowskyi TaxID=360622 RepID=A0AAD8MWT7_9APIA|nr:hypothetical protein POM88_011801 [Heracleum sosnowskyi]
MTSMLELVLLICIRNVDIREGEIWNNHSVKSYTRYESWFMGYGFVKFDTPSAASLAIMHMNGYQIDGHRLRVRIAGAPPATAQPATSLFPVHSNPGPTAVATSYPALPHCMMPKAEASVLNIEGIVVQLRASLDMGTGSNKGFGFVRFDTPSAASLAIMHMNGHEIDGHRLTVRIPGATPATEQPATSIVPIYPFPGPATVATSCAALPGGLLPEAQVSVLSGEGLCYPSSQCMVYSTNLYVGYLPRTIDDSCLRDLFSPFGTVTYSRVILDMSSGYSKGYGFVSFDTPFAASLAIMHMNGYEIDGQKLAEWMRTASARRLDHQPRASFLYILFLNL